MRHGTALVALLLCINASGILAGARAEETGR
jgi:hypothetical protein